MSPLPKPVACEACPMYSVGHGFVSDEGDPQAAKLMICMDAPGPGDVTAIAEPDELARRRQVYPDVPTEILRRGRPAMSEWVQLSQVLSPVGLHRKDVFLMHAIRCCPDMKGGKYPTGDVRKKAEATCRQWDRHRAPTVVMSNFRPRDLMTDITPLPLVVRAMEKARDFAAQGERVLVMAGTKVVKVFQGYRENVGRFVGDYTLVTDDLVSAQQDRWNSGRALVLREKGERTVRRKKLTTKDALRILLSSYEWCDDGTYVPIKAKGWLTREQYEEMTGLLETKPRKVKDAEPISAT